MRVYLAVWALCLIAVVMTCEPNNSTSFPQSNPQTQADNGVTAPQAHDQNCKPCGNPANAGNSSPQGDAPLKRPEWWLVILGFPTLGFLIYQAIVSGRAASTAEKNTELYISKERARLRVDIKPLTFPSEINPAYNTVDFTVSIYGPTDALITESSCVAYFYPWHVIDNPDLADLAMHPIHLLPSVIPTNSPPIECYAFLHIAATGNANDNVIIAEIKAKHLAVGIRGWIKYRDVFDRERETAFRHVWRYNDAMYGLGEEFGDWIERGKPEENRKT